MINEENLSEHKGKVFWIRAYCFSVVLAVLGTLSVVWLLFHFYGKLHLIFWFIGFSAGGISGFIVGAWVYLLVFDRRGRG